MNDVPVNAINSIQQYDPRFDRLGNLFHSILSQRNDLDPSVAADEAVKVYEKLNAVLEKP